MATSEVQAIRQEQASPASDSDPGPSKPGHNNPEKVAHYLKDITGYTDVFMENISSFNRYAVEDAYQNYVFNLHKQMMEFDNKYFKYTSVDTVLDTLLDKKCKLFVEKLVDDPQPDDTIVPRESPKTLPTGHDVLTRLVYEVDHKALDDKGQKVVVRLFSELSNAHDNLSTVAKSRSKLGKITSPEQFGFILKLAI